MAEKQTDEEREVDEEDESSEEPSDERESEPEGGEEDAPVRADGGEQEEASPTSSPAPDALAKRETEEEGELEEGEHAAAQLGTDRYVLAGFFAAGMLGAYVFGRTIQLAWSTFSNRDWFSRALPRLAAVPDDDKGTYSLVLAGIIALFLVVRTYKRPEVRTWSEEVATELTKVKWPTRKEVTNSTIIVIAASAVATIYLALLDRLWAFVTGIVYGDGSGV